MIGLFSILITSAIVVIVTDGMQKVLQLSHGGVVRLILGLTSTMFKKKGQNSVDQGVGQKSKII